LAEFSKEFSKEFYFYVNKCLKITVAMQYPSRLPQQTVLCSTFSIRWKEKRKRKLYKLTKIEKTLQKNPLCIDRFKRR
jgi:hypothetical protein